MKTWAKDLTRIETEDVRCACSAHPQCETIRVPVTMLIKPGAQRTTPRYRETVIHNLIEMNRLFRKYPVV